MSVVYGNKYPIADSPLTLAGWLNAEHVQHTPYGRPDVESHLERKLAALGHPKRSIRLKISSLAALGGIVASTSMVSSLPQTDAVWLSHHFDIRHIPHPIREFEDPIRLKMSWHEVHHQDAGHQWLRGWIGDHLDQCLAAEGSTA